MWFEALCEVYLCSWEGALYEQRPCIDAFIQKRREICIFRYSFVQYIMGPTNGKNIIHVSNCRQKRSVYTLPFNCSHCTKRENLQNGRYQIGWFLHSCTLKIIGQKYAQIWETTTSWRPYPFHRNDYRCAMTHTSDIFV